MGADIHSVLQARRDGTWRTIPLDEIPESCREHWAHRPEDWEPAWEVRNYRHFGIFAGVRDEDVKPIAAPRGFPDDVETADGDHGPEIDGHWLGDHSYSWVTAAELAAVDLDIRHPEYGHMLREMTTIDRWLPYWLSLADDPTDVRLVFGFDS